LTEPESVPSSAIRRLVETFSGLGIEYAIVGGVAASLQSKPRFTADVDSVLLDIDERIEWFVEELRKAGYKSRSSDPIGFARRTRVLTFTDPSGVDVDMMMGLLPFDIDLVKGAQTVSLGSFEVRIATPEKLVVMKAIAWRDKDRLDILHLVAYHPEMDFQEVTDSFNAYVDILEEPERKAEFAEFLKKAKSARL
jgi:hypothetical protein